MKEAIRILAYFAGVLFLGALLAPPLWWMGQAAAPHLPGLAFLQETDFRRFFNRAMLLAAVLLLWPAVRCLRIGSVRELGLEPNPRAGRDLAAGFLLACLPLYLLGAALLRADVYRWKPILPWSDLPGIALTAAVVAVIEEALFRGGFQGLVARSSGPRFAWLFVAALFAILHFLKPRESVIDNVTWTSGFALVPHAFWQFGNLSRLATGFATLLVVGLMLGSATLRTRSLWLPIGLHAGWVFGLKSFSRFTRRANRDTLPWLGENLLEGLAPLLVLGVTWAALAVLLRRVSNEPLARPRA